MGLRVAELDYIWHYHTPVDHPDVIVDSNPRMKFPQVMENEFGHFRPFSRTVVQTFLGYSLAERQALADAVRRYLVPDRGDVSGRGGLRTGDNELFQKPDPELKKFLGDIHDHVVQALDRMFFQRSNVRGEVSIRFAAWGYALREGDYIDPHQHTSGMLSGTYYLSVPDSIAHRREGGAIQLFTPNLAEGFLPRTGQLANKMELFPANDMLIMFPSYLWHSVAPVPGGGERLALTFDVMNG